MGNRAKKKTKEAAGVDDFLVYPTALNPLIRSCNVNVNGTLCYWHRL
jgi:hypothetical protein